MSGRNFFRASAEDFKKIPGSPVAYWVSDTVASCFLRFGKISDYAKSSVGLQTGDNDKFIHMWWEVVFGNIKFDAVTSQDSFQEKRYFPYNKGGVFRKWHGNNECVVVWRNNGEEIIKNAERTGHHWQQYAEELKFQPMVTWSRISSGDAAFRYKPHGYMSDMAGFSVYPQNAADLPMILGYTNSKPCREFLKFMSPTLNFMLGQVISLPLCHSDVIRNQVRIVVKRILEIAEDDYAKYETSWDFAANPLIAVLNSEREKAGDSSGEAAIRDQASDGTLQGIYEKARAGWAANCEEMRRLETENNRIFIEAYGLQDELTPEVPWHEITLTCNPWYRYGVRSADDGEGAVATQELEERLRADAVKELISYAVGCMMGRYAIDKPGLVLANQGATYEDYLAQISEPAFAPDDDGIIPILEDDCFADDIVTQFHRFLRVTFGERNFNANLSFIEDALGKDLRSYFVKDFYADHLQRYQKRPIYWLFSSPKGTFSALIYLHRYHPGTVGQVLGYLRSHITKIQSRVDAADRTAADSAATQGMKTRAIKERAKLVRQLKELEDYERDVLHPLAGQRIEIDLDDGVKANYPKFGKALRKIPGLE